MAMMITMKTTMMKKMRMKKKKKKKKKKIGIDWIEIEPLLGMEMEERKAMKRRGEDILSKRDQRQVDLLQSLKMRPKIPKLKQQLQPSSSLLPSSLLLSSLHPLVLVLDLDLMIQTMTLS